MYQIRIGNGNVLYRFICYPVSGDEFGITNTIARYALFMLFLNTKVKYSKAINTVASTTFGVLLIHDSNTFRTTFWHIVNFDSFISDPFILFVAETLIVAATIFVVCSIIDYARQVLLERPLFATERMKRFEKKFDDIVNKQQS